MVTRRGFLKSATTVVMLPLVPWAKVLPPTDSSRDVLDLPKGSTIEDLIVSVNAGPREASLLVTFYLPSDPETPVLRVPMHCRSVYRWAAPLGYEIYVPPNERLCWRYTTLPEHAVQPHELVVGTMGHDKANGKVIVQQEWYA